MLIYYVYVLCFIAFSGFGSLFLNSESILSVCFYVFFVLVLQNSDSASQGLEQTRQNIRKQLACGMLDAQQHKTCEQQQHLLKGTELVLESY